MSAQCPHYILLRFSAQVNEYEKELGRGSELGILADRCDRRTDCLKDGVRAGILYRGAEHPCELGGKIQLLLIREQAQCNCHSISI